MANNNYLLDLLELDDQRYRVKVINDRKKVNNALSSVKYLSRDFVSGRRKIVLGDGSIDYASYQSNAKVDTGDKLDIYNLGTVTNKPA